MSVYSRDQDLGQYIESLISDLKIDMMLPANVFLARDTRYCDLLLILPMHS